MGSWINWRACWNRGKVFTVSMKQTGKKNKVFSGFSDLPVDNWLKTVDKCPFMWINRSSVRIMINSKPPDMVGSYLTNPLLLLGINCGYLLLKDPNSCRYFPQFCIGNCSNFTAICS